MIKTLLHGKKSPVCMTGLSPATLGVKAVPFRVEQLLLRYTFSEMPTVQINGLSILLDQRDVARVLAQSWSACRFFGAATFLNEVLAA